MKFKSFKIACFILLTATSFCMAQFPDDQGGENATPADQSTDNSDGGNVDTTSQANGALKPLPVSQRLDGIFAREIHKQKEIIGYDHMREADMFWQKRVWRVIDTREKFNLAFVYPKELFFDIIHRAAMSGEVTAFDPLDDEFTTQLKIDEIRRIGAGSDTVMVEDLNTGEMVQKVTTRTLNSENIKRFRLKEEWFFDEETSTMQVRIIGIAPVMEKYNENGDYLGTQVLYWLYYPDLRPLLIKHEIFNPRNDAVRMTWEDVMEMRFFSSYIIKESNVYDRKIDGYQTGIDALLEGERVKDDIFKFEHDLWSF
jgi:gliding motility associated protien GldN